ncbi:hypothetical protein TgHK011_001140 [Trichoderma gracile]|nr:hypothetical protein TgHK011_001140 [Trichoderma gracile]
MFDAHLLVPSSPHHALELSKTSRGLTCSSAASQQSRHSPCRTEHIISADTVMASYLRCTWAIGSSASSSAADLASSICVFLSSLHRTPQTRHRYEPPEPTLSVPGCLTSSI